jgi:hypothetical protein
MNSDSKEEPSATPPKKTWVQKVCKTMALGVMGGGPLVSADESSNGEITKLYDKKYLDNSRGR